MRITKSIPTTFWIIVAELFSDLANQFVQLTLLDVLFFRGDRALSNLLFICLVEQTPSIFMSPLASWWIDRVGCRKWLVLVTIGKSLLVALLIFSVSPWVVFPAYFCFVAGSLFFSIGRLSFIPLLVRQDDLIFFNALNERISLIGRIIGPCIIGWTVQKASRGITLTAAGLLFALSATCISRLPHVCTNSGRTNLSRGRKVKQFLCEYAVPFRKNHHLKAYFTIFGFILLGGGILNLGLPVFYKANLGQSIADWGMIMSGFQAGACSATFLLPGCSRAFRHQSLLSVTFLILAGAMAVLRYATTTFHLTCLMFLFGGGTTFIHVLLDSLIQKGSSKAYLTKTISLLSTFKGVCYIGIILSSALILETWGPQFLLLTGSMVMVSASIVSRK